MTLTKTKFHLYICLWLAFVWGGYLSPMGSSLWTVCVIMASLGMMPLLHLAEHKLFPRPLPGSSTEIFPRPYIRVVAGGPGSGKRFSILRFHFHKDKDADPHPDH